MMKVPLNNRKRSFLNIKNELLTTGVFLVLLFTFAGCKSNSRGRILCGPGIASAAPCGGCGAAEASGANAPCRIPPVKAFIYGKVDSIPAYNKQHKYFKYEQLKILVLLHPQGCNKVDSTQSKAAIIAIADVSKSGNYNEKLQVPHFSPTSACFNASLVAYHNFGGVGGSQYGFDYDTLLAGPKKFDVIFHTNPPYDSVK